MQRTTLMIATAIALLLAGCAEDAPAAPDAGASPASAPTSPGGAEAVDAADESVGEAPHAHDYWSGRERVNVLDATYEVAPEEAAMWGVLSTRFLGEPAFGGAEVNLAEGQLVYEGTGALEITVTWSDPGVTGMRFLHRHAGSGDIQPWTRTPNGETVRVDVAPEMTDMPHAQSSRWAFLFVADGTPAVAVGAFHVAMDIVKTRDIALWPGHPDLWGEQTEIQVVDADGVAVSQAGPAEEAQSDPWADPPDAVPAQGLVPMETARLLVTLTVQSVDPDLDVDHLHLYVRTAADLQFDFQEAGDAVAISDDRLVWTWAVEVAMEQTDNPYATASAFAFRATAAYANPVPGAPPCEDGATMPSCNII